jgi:hypothetical protein
MKIIIQAIPHNQQRYETVGDWHELNNKTLLINVSDTGNDDYSFLVGIHEAIEFWLCKKRGITDEEVTAFDKAFEEARPENNTDEPGNDPAAPYNKEHVFATKIERQLADELGIDWDEYDKAIYSL